MINHLLLTHSTPVPNHLVSVRSLIGNPIATIFYPNTTSLILNLRPFEQMPSVVRTLLFVRYLPISRCSRFPIPRFAPGFPSDAHAHKQPDTLKLAHRYTRRHISQAVLLSVWQKVLVCVKLKKYSYVMGINAFLIKGESVSTANNNNQSCNNKGEPQQRLST